MISHVKRIKFRYEMYDINNRNQIVNGIILLAKVSTTT